MNTNTSIQMGQCDTMLMFLPIAKIQKNLGSEWVPAKARISGQYSFRSTKSKSSIIISSAPYPTPGDDDYVEWVHASISRNLKLPSYDDLKMLHKAVFTDGWSYQIFTPPSRHINIHAFALHLFGRLDGKPQLPDFQKISGINSI